MVKILFFQIKEWIPYKGTGARAQDLTEYGLLFALIAIVVVLAVIFFGDSLSGFWSEMGDEVAGIFSPTCCD